MLTASPDSDKQFAEIVNRELQSRGAQPSKGAETQATSEARTQDIVNTSSAVQVQKCQGCTGGCDGCVFSKIAELSLKEDELAPPKPPSDPSHDPSPNPSPAPVSDDLFDFQLNPDVDPSVTGNVQDAVELVANEKEKAQSQKSSESTQKEKGVEASSEKAKPEQLEKSTQEQQQTSAGEKVNSAVKSDKSVSPITDKVEARSDVSSEVKSQKPETAASREVTTSERKIESSPKERAEQKVEHSAAVEKLVERKADLAQHKSASVAEATIVNNLRTEASSRAMASVSSSSIPTKDQTISSEVRKESSPSVKTVEARTAETRMLERADAHRRVSQNVISNERTRAPEVRKIVVPNRAATNERVVTSNRIVASQATAGRFNTRSITANGIRQREASVTRQALLQGDRRRVVASVASRVLVRDLQRMNSRGVARLERIAIRPLEKLPLLRHQMLNRVATASERLLGKIVRNLNAIKIGKIDQSKINTKRSTTGLSDGKKTKADSVVALRGAKSIKGVDQIRVKARSKEALLVDGQKAATAIRRGKQMERSSNPSATTQSSIQTSKRVASQIVAQIGAVKELLLRARGGVKLDPVVKKLALSFVNEGIIRLRALNSLNLRNNYKQQVEIRHQIQTLLLLLKKKGVARDMSEEELAEIRSLSNSLLEIQILKPRIKSRFKSRLKSKKELKAAQGAEQSNKKANALDGASSAGSKLSAKTGKGGFRDISSHKNSGGPSAQLSVYSHKSDDDSQEENEVSVAY